MNLQRRLGTTVNKLNEKRHGYHFFQIIILIITIHKGQKGKKEKSRLLRAKQVKEDSLAKWNKFWGIVLLPLEEANEFEESRDWKYICLHGSEKMCDFRENSWNFAMKYNKNLTSTAIQEHKESTDPHDAAHPIAARHSRRMAHPMIDASPLDPYPKPSCFAAWCGMVVWASWNNCMYSKENNQEYLQKSNYTTKIIL